MKKNAVLVFAAFLAVLVFFATPAHAFMTREHIHERDDLRDTFMKLFAAEDFTGLDEKMNHAQQDYEQGKWNDLDLWFLFLNVILGDDADFASDFDMWVKTYPRSYAARMERGLYYMDMAQASDEKGKKKDYLNRAIQDNKDALALTKKPITAYVNLTELYGLSGDFEESLKIADRANIAMPLNTEVRRQYLLQLKSADEKQPGAYISRMRDFLSDVRKSKLSTYMMTRLAAPFFTRLLQDGLYSELDREMNNLQQAYESGAIDDVALKEGFDALQEENPELEGKFDAWVQAYPHSYAARQARSSYYINSAMTARGEDSIGNTSDDEIAGMQLYFKKALDESTDALPLAKKPILTYGNMLTITKYTGGEMDAKEILEKADEMDPKNYSVRSEYMHFSEARWGGSLAQMESFMKEVEASGMRNYEMVEFEDMILDEKKWMAMQVSKDFSNIGQVETGF